MDDWRKKAEQGESLVRQVMLDRLVWEHLQNKSCTACGQAFTMEDTDAVCSGHTPEGRPVFAHLRCHN